jgi:hypothetical protein
VNARSLIENDSEDAKDELLSAEQDFSGKTADDLNKVGINPYDLQNWVEVCAVGTAHFRGGSTCDYAGLRGRGVNELLGYFAVENRSQFESLVGYMIPFEAETWSRYRLDFNAAFAPPNLAPFSLTQ